MKSRLSGLKGFHSLVLTCCYQISKHEGIIIISTACSSSSQQDRNLYQAVKKIVTLPCPSILPVLQRSGKQRSNTSSNRNLNTSRDNFARKAHLRFALAVFLSARFCISHSHRSSQKGHLHVFNSKKWDLLVTLWFKWIGFWIHPPPCIHCTHTSTNASSYTVVMRISSRFVSIHQHLLFFNPAISVFYSESIRMKGVYNSRGKIVENRSWKCWCPWPAARASHRWAGWGSHQHGWSDDACATTQPRLRHELAWIAFFWAGRRDAVMSTPRVWMEMTCGGCLGVKPARSASDVRFG